jgi:hypothetical protein
MITFRSVGVAARLFCLLALEISAGKRGEAQRSGREFFFHRFVG